MDGGQIGNVAFDMTKMLAQRQGVEQVRLRFRRQGQSGYVGP